MNTIPDKLSALRQSLEATIVQQNIETQQELERKVCDSCKDAEDKALKRAEDLFTPQINSTTERLQVLIESARTRVEEVFPKIAEAVHDRSEEQTRELLAKISALEERLVQRIDEMSEHSMRQLKLGDEDVARCLRAEMQAVSQLAQKSSEDFHELAEGIVQNAIWTLRTELESLTKRAVSSGERNVEQKARELVAKMNEGFEAGNLHCESVREGCSAALHEATSVLRTSVTDMRTALSAEAASLRQLIKSTEERFVEVAEETERKAVDGATRRLQDTAVDIRKELGEVKQSLSDAGETLRQNQQQLLDEAVGRIGRDVEEKAASAQAHHSQSLRQVVLQLQSELADACKVANERTDQIRCQAADSLSKEVEARCEAVLAAEALIMRAREDARIADNEVIARAAASEEKLDRRLDAVSDAFKGLQRSLEAVEKVHADSMTSLQNQLRTDRQGTEETAAQASQQRQEVRDSLEALLQNEATNLRASMADARKKIHEEASALRAELREQPSKRELGELASTTTAQYNELSNVIDSHRSRLEAVVAECGSRVREARGEAGEARLRMQRETMTLGSELTTLRAAASSLANGLFKTLQVLGFLRDEVDCASGKDAGNMMKEHHRGIEIEDLLEWEKVGKSLATRIARQWYVKESAGISSVLSMVERKVDIEDLATLKSLIRECSLATHSLKFNETGSTMVPFSPTSPKSSSESPPEGVTKAREQRLVHTDDQMKVL